MILTLNDLGRPLTANALRKLTPHAQAKRIAEWRTLGEAAVRQQQASDNWQRIRQHVLSGGRVKISCAPTHANKRSPQDVAACAPALKAVIDGAIDAGLLEDDGQDVFAAWFERPRITGEDGLIVWIDTCQP